MKKLIFLFIPLMIIGCSGPEARRPVQVKTGSFIKESAERNKQLLAEEEKLIQDIIKADTLHTYHKSTNASWYFYEKENKDASYLPKENDLVTMTYNLVDFKNDTIYTNQEIGIFKYKVDKQKLFVGLRNSVKLLKEGETATFLFPSSLGYGYLGDKNKIGTNIPLKATVSILEIEKNKDSIQN